MLAMRAMGLIFPGVFVCPVQFFFSARLRSAVGFVDGDDRVFVFEKIRFVDSIHSYRTGRLIQFIRLAPSHPFQLMDGTRRGLGIPIGNRK